MRPKSSSWRRSTRMILIWDRLNAHRAYRVQDYLAEHPQLTTTARRHTRSLQRKSDLLRFFLKYSPLSLRLR